MYRYFYKSFEYFNRKSKVIIHTTMAESFGNCAEDILFGLLKAKRENKKVLFLHPHSLGFRRFAANRSLFHFRSDYSVQGKLICSLGGWALTCHIALTWVLTRASLSRLRRIARVAAQPKNLVRALLDFGHSPPTIGRSTLWNPDEAGFFSWQVVEHQNWKRQYDEYVAPTLLKNDHHRAERLRVEMGIPLDAWFVCLHVREGGYRKDHGSIYRNDSIQNHIEGIKLITDSGGWVVRLGDPSMSTLAPMERVIDYPHTRFKSELMDMYLISQCQFFVGPNSGPFCVAVLFGKPMMLVNVTEWSIGYPVTKGDLVIIKHVFSRSRDRFLSVKEILDEPMDWQIFNSGSDEYVMVENTRDEIRDAIEEYLSKPDGYEYSELQESFNERRKRQIHRWFDHEERFANATPENGLFPMYRMASRCDAAEGSMGQKYLEQNWHTDNLEKSSLKPSIQ